jgi:hypothetical protein
MARSLGAIRTKQESQERRLDARGFRWQPVHKCGLVEGTRPSLSSHGPLSVQVPYLL